MRRGLVEIEVHLEREGLAPEKPPEDALRLSHVLYLDHLGVTQDVPGASAALKDSLFARLKAAVREWESEVQAIPVLVKIDTALKKEADDGTA